MRLATGITGIGEPTLVLLHGLASTRRVFDLVVPQLAKTHRAIAFDQRGHGESEKPDDGYSLEAFATDIDEILRRHGVSRPVFVGHSFGANVALHHAATRAAARRLVLVDGGLVEMHAHLSWEHAAERLAPPPDDPHENDRWVRDGSPDIPNSPQLAEIRRSLFELQGNGMLRKRLTRERHLKILRSLWEQDVHEQLARVRCPTLLLVPRRQTSDALAQRWLRQKELAVTRVGRFPHVAIRWLEDTVHDVSLQRPAELAREILEFVSRT